MFLIIVASTALRVHRLTSRARFREVLALESLMWLRRKNSRHSAVTVEFSEIRNCVTYV